MDVHTSFPPPSKRQASSSGHSASQRQRTTSHHYNPRSVYTNPSPATSRADSPTALRGHGAGSGPGYTGPYRMIPGKSKPHFAHPQQQQQQKKLDILAPVPRRHLIDSSASSLWLGGDHGGTRDSPPPSEPTTSQRGMSLSPEPGGRGLSPNHHLHPEPDSPITPTSPTLHALHHQHSPTLRARRSPSFLRSSESDLGLPPLLSSGLAVPSTAPAGTSKFFAQQQQQRGLGVSGSSSGFVGPAQGAPRRRVSSQAFGTLYQNKKGEREGSVGPPSGMRSVSLQQQQQRPGFYRPEGDAREREREGMGKAWIRWMHKRGIRAWIIPVLVLVSTLVKFCVGLGDYSGHDTPPMYGDYEAQRHWMELTLHLPFRQWYKYDLQYWGLDYPPLTAYVSWICGVVGHWINPKWVALDASRGIETETSKIFMRTTVIVWDMLVYVPALVMFVRTWQGTRSGRTQELALLTLLFQPALLLIDFGHFQYNTVMLGFTLLAMNFFATGQDLAGAVCFVLSLGFKQMALYYAPAIGSYLLAKCLYLGVPGPGFKHFTRLGVTTVSSFLVLFLPFYLPPFAPSVTSIMDPITRIFPFNRGLFEDKVANFWCASNVALKWRERLGRNVLVKMSAGLTGVGFLPSVGTMLSAGWRVCLPTTATSKRETQGEEEVAQAPFLTLLPFALLTSSFSFFLFSFQVHEKTILVPLLPMTLLLSGAPVDSSVYAWGVLVNNIGVFSMWPLLKKDGLGLQYFVLLVLWNRLIGYNPLRLPPGTFVQLLSLATYAAAIGLHILEMMFTPPARYPDIYPVLNVLVSTPVFVLAWLWSIKCGIEVGWALGGLGPASGSSGPGDSGVVGKAVSAGDDGQKEGRAVGLGYGKRKGGGRHGSLKSRTSSSSLLE